MLKAGLERRPAWAGVILGFAVHWKIYPFIYAPSLVWFLDSDGAARTWAEKLTRFFNADRIKLAAYSLTTFMAFNIAMYIM